MYALDSFQNEACGIVGPDHCVSDPVELANLTVNTLAVERRIVGAVSPESTSQVVALVSLARRTGVPLYPVSRGRNVGYGERAPAMDGHVLLDLSRMRAVRDYDAQLGHVVVEAGVSQQDLYDFLRQSGAPYMMDATGAGLDASIVGNTLEGGFGHTPLGNHRECFTDAEVVLGDGSLLRTGRFPGIGPDLKGIFVQSNFGVVTAMRVPLMPMPEHFESFVARSDREDGVIGMVDALRILRMEGILTSCVHLANPVRYLVTSRPCPPEYLSRLVTDADASRIMSSWLLPVGYWNAVGGLYGLKKSVGASKRRIAEVFGKVGHVRFFCERTLGILEAMANRISGWNVAALVRITDSIRSFRHIHDMMKGVPTDEPYKNISWKVDKREDLGLIWFAPTVEAKGAKVSEVLSLAKPLFHIRSFDMPVTITLVTADSVILVFNIVFNKTEQTQKERAYLLYSELHETMSKHGINIYRSSVLGMSDICWPDSVRHEIVSKLKQALDPENIISRGRYGIGIGMKSATG